MAILSSCLCLWTTIEYSKVRRNSQRMLATSTVCTGAALLIDPCQWLWLLTCSDRHLRGALTRNTCCHLEVNSPQALHVWEIFHRSADVAGLLLPRKQYPIFRMSLPWQKNHKFRIHKYLSCYLMQSKIVPYSIFSSALVLSNFKWFSFYISPLFFRAWCATQWFRVFSFAVSDVYWRTWFVPVWIKQMLSFT